MIDFEPSAQQPVEQQIPVESPQPVTTAEEVNSESIFTNQDDAFSFAILKNDEAQTIERGNTGYNTSPFQTPQGAPTMQNFITYNYETVIGKPLSDAERYTAEKAVVNANRETVIPLINDYQAGKLNNDYEAKLEEAGFSGTLTDTESEQVENIMTQIMCGEELDASSMTNLPTEVQAALTELSENQNEYKFYAPDCDVDDIPHEAIVGADYSSVKQLNLATIRTLVNPTGDGDGAIKTGDDLAFKPKTEAIHLADLTGQDDSHVKIQDRIASIYGLEDTNGDGHVSLNSDAGTGIIHALMEANPEVFNGFDFAKNGGAEGAMNKIEEYLTAHPDYQFKTKAVDISSTDSSITRESITAEGVNTYTPTQLHVTTSSLKIGEGGTETLDELVDYALNFVQYQSPSGANTIRDKETGELRDYTIADALEEYGGYDNAPAELKEIADSAKQQIRNNSFNGSELALQDINFVLRQTHEKIQVKAEEHNSSVEGSGGDDKGGGKTTEGTGECPEEVEIQTEDQTIIEHT